MFMDLGSDLGPVRWPRGVEPRRYRDGEDDRLMYETMRAGFGDDWPEGSEAKSWIQGHREAAGFHPDLWLFACCGELVVGAVQCREQWHGQGDTGWVKNLAVLPEWRGRGIGRALLFEAFAVLRRRGRRRAVLGVDDANPTGAKSFYEGVGMRRGGGSTDFRKIIE